MLNLTFFAFLAFLFGFGFLVFIHELGHFLVAKWVGIRCTQFAIGFGPAVCSWRKGIGFRIGSTEQAYHDRAAAALLDRGPGGEDPTSEQLYAAADSLGLGETEYRLNYLPLGGYVKMLGQEDLDAGARSNDPRSFNSKSVGARFAVISAGVIMNMITGILFFIIAFMSGVEFPPPVVGGVAPGSPAATTYAVGHEDDPAYRGLRVDDRVLEIDGERIRDSIEIRLASALAAEGDPLELLVQRPGVDGPLVFRITPVKSPMDNLLSLGIEPPRDLRVFVIKGSDAEKAGLEPDMRLTEVDGQPVATYGDYYRMVTEKRGEPVMAVFVDDEKGKRVELPLRAFPILPRNEERPASLGGFLRATRVEGVEEGSPAEAAGIRPGDLLAAVGPEAWPAQARVPQLVAEAEGRPIEVTVQREGKTVEIGALMPRRDKLGIAIGTDGPPVIASAVPGTPAADLNLPPGSRILEVSGTAVDDWTHAIRVLQTQAEQALGEGRSSLSVPLRVEANVAGHPVEELTLTLDEAHLESLATVAWEPPLPFDFGFDVLREPVEAQTPWEATMLGLQRTKQFVMQAYVMLLRLAQGTVKSEHLRGPVGIIDEGTKVARGGWSYLFYFLGLLSVNLAVINFLPIPIADGGHAVFLLAEKIKGSPVSARVQIAAMYVGLALIGGVFLLVTYQDIVRKIGELTG